MSSDLSWEPEYCLACDRQTDGATYCSESCRLSDFEKTSSSSTPASTPGVAGSSSYNWTAPRPQAKFYLPPAYDFSNAQPYGSTPVPQSYLSQRSDSSASSTRVLTPSSSHSSLCSLRSTSSSGSESTQVSDKAKKQLRDYASSFEHARVQQQRRRSY
ncbi:Karyopherin transporter [Hypoxylon texense]